MPNQTINLGHVVGADGKSPYQYAVEAGYTGTEQEYKELVASGPWLPIDGGTMTGNINMGDHQITGVSQINAQGTLSETVGIYANSGIAFVVESSYWFDFKNDGFHSYNCGIDLHNNGLLNVKSPTNSTDGANKGYVDGKSIQYGTCTTASGTAAKTASLSGFTLSTGAMVCIRFTYANTGSITLNVNSTGARTVRVGGRNLVAGDIQASYNALLRYDGSYWQLLNPCANGYVDSKITYGTDPVGSTLATGTIYIQYE